MHPTAIIFYLVNIVTRKPGAERLLFLCVAGGILPAERKNYAVKF